MSLPHFPSYRWNRRGFNWYDYKEVNEWKKEHEKLLREFFETFDHVIHNLKPIYQKEYEEKKKSLGVGK